MKRSIADKLSSWIPHFISTPKVSKKSECTAIHKSHPRFSRAPRAEIVAILKNRGFEDLNEELVKLQSPTDTERIVALMRSAVALKEARRTRYFREYW